MLAGTIHLLHTCACRAGVEWSRQSREVYLAPSPRGLSTSQARPGRGWSTLSGPAGLGVAEPHSMAVARGGTVHMPSTRPGQDWDESPEV